MRRYLISFDDGAMDQIADEDVPEVGRAAHAVVQGAKDAGSWTFGGGVERQLATVVDTDGTITDGPLLSRGAGTFRSVGRASSREQVSAAR